MKQSTDRLREVVLLRVIGLVTGQVSAQGLPALPEAVQQSLAPVAFRHQRQGGDGPVRPGFVCRLFSLVLRGEAELEQVAGGGGVEGDPVQGQHRDLQFARAHELLHRLFLQRPYGRFGALRGGLLQQGPDVRGVAAVVKTELRSLLCRRRVIGRQQAVSYGGGGRGEAAAGRQQHGNVAKCGQLHTGGGEVVFEQIRQRRVVGIAFTPLPEEGLGGLPRALVDLEDACQIHPAAEYTRRCRP